MRVSAECHTLLNEYNSYHAKEQSARLTIRASWYFWNSYQKGFWIFCLYFQFLIWTARSVAFIASNEKESQEKLEFFSTKEYKNVRWIRSKNQARRADRDSIGWELEKVWGEACNIGLGNTGLFKNGWERIPTLIYPPQDNLGQREH